MKNNDDAIMGFVTFVIVIFVFLVIAAACSSAYDSHTSYDDGYNDIYDDADYDWDRYQEDDDYASGVDDAMDDWNEEYGEDW